MPGFVAEVSSNHHRDLQRCYAFIDTAARIGCDAVKFQLFKVDELFAPEILRVSEQHRQRRQWELPEDYVPLLARRCREQAVEFGCTPFSLTAVDILEPHVDFYKIASYELLWNDLLVACAGTGKPLVLSTGMATLQEVKDAVQTVRNAGCEDLTVLHCISSYPVAARQCNLAALDTLRRECRCKVGWSDHSVDAGVIHRAVHRWGAELLEFHLDLEGGGEEFGSGHCWLPQHIEPVIAAVRSGLDADGDGVKTPMPAERPDRDWRADPADGLRPLRALRRRWAGAQAGITG